MAAGECGIEQAKIPLAGAFAEFVISSDHDPRGGSQEISRRRKEIGIPCRPIIAPRTVLASAVLLRALALPIEIVADMDDEIWFGFGCRRAQI